MAGIDTALGNSKVPPAWSPEVQETYRVVDWETDVHTWTLATDIPPAQQGPTLALRIGGEARTLVRQVNPQMLSQGVNIRDGQGIFMFFTGVQVVVRIITRRLGPDDEDRNI